MSQWNGGVPAGAFLDGGFFRHLCKSWCWCFQRDTWRDSAGIPFWAGFLSNPLRQSQRTAILVYIQCSLDFSKSLKQAGNAQVHGKWSAAFEFSAENWNCVVVLALSAPSNNTRHVFTQTSPLFLQEVSLAAPTKGWWRQHPSNPNSFLFSEIWVKIKCIAGLREYSFLDTERVKP